MNGVLKKKKALLAFALADAVLLGTVVTKAKRFIKGKAHEKVIDVVIKDNKRRTGGEESGRVEKSGKET